jgi:hypothetical protein
MLNTNFNLVNPNLIAMEEFLSAEDVARLRDYLKRWDFFNGFHWEDLPDDGSGKPEITENWCRRFVNKFVEAEFNNGFTIKMSEEAEEKILPFLNEVWEDNARDRLLQDVGQMKSVTGDAYIHVMYEPKYLSGQLNPNFDDPFNLYEKGRIRLFSIPSSIVFPKFKPGYNMYDMEECNVVFPVPYNDTSRGTSLVNRYHIMKYTYTKDTITVYMDGEVVTREENPYGIIPIIHLKNQVLSGAHYGISDIEDIIPLNVELNLKNSDVSEILDYHAKPVTAVFGARVSQLEKGANKVWGGLPKDARIENIELKSDLGASSNYKEEIRDSMKKIAGMPNVALGDDLASNLSGVALHIAFLPLTDTIKTKHACTKEALKLVNRLILKIAIKEGLLSVDELNSRQIYNFEIIQGDLLPKDKVIELEQIQQELKMGVDSRKNVMKRLKKDNIESLIKEIDVDRKENPKLYGAEPVALAVGYKLVSSVDGKVIGENKQIIPPTPEGNNSPKPSQLPNKPVGNNKEGKDIKVNSGVTNTNPKK